MKFLTKKARQGELPSVTITYKWSIGESVAFVNTKNKIVHPFITLKKKQRQLKKWLYQASNTLIFSLTFLLFYATIECCKIVRVSLQLGGGKNPTH